MYQKSIDASKCTSCMQCEAICTNSRVIVQNENFMPEFRYNNRCIYCGHCLAICPEGAIEFIQLPNTQTQPDAYYAQTVEHSIEDTPLQPDVVFDFLCGTRSTRIFKDQPVESEKLKIVIDAMTRAASAGNEQNRNFYVISNPKTLHSLEQALSDHFAKSLKALKNPLSCAVISFFYALRAGKQNTDTLATSQMLFRQRYRFIKAILKDAVPKSDSAFSYLKHAPVVIMITKGEKYSAMHRSFYRGDACISATYGILMAKGLNLASCRMGLLEIAFTQKTKLKDLIPLKPGERLDAAFALGYSDLRWRRIPPRGPVQVTWLP